MKRSVTAKDISTFAKLDMVYNQIRVIEAKQNETEYKCLGSGKCCHIGLVVPMTECANIAFKLNQNYYLIMEDKGKEEADAWFEKVVDGLIEAMYDDSWQPGGESKRLCAFYKGGCTIYQYRPMVCRTFGTITTVDDYCPRIRNAHGQIDYFTGEAVKKIVKQYQNLLKEYAEDKHENYDMTVYMPLGVLSFILSSEELEKLSKDTNPKFWSGVSGWFNYRVQYTKEHGYSLVELKKSAESVGKSLSFDPDE